MVGGAGWPRKEKTGRQIGQGKGGGGKKADRPRKVRLNKNGRVGRARNIVFFFWGGGGTAWLT
jgi:hypothetical protein